MNQFLVLPDCGSPLELGAIDVDQDCTLYVQRYSQVCGVILLPDVGSLPPDWTDAASWATVIDNGIASTTKGKYIIGEGNVPAPDEEELNYPKRMRRIQSRLYTVTLDIKNMSDAQYAFLRLIQSGYIDFRFWIETVGGRLLGGSTGIDPQLATVSFVYAGGKDDKEIASLVIEYQSDGDPLRADVPGIADAVAGVVSQGIGVMVIETDFQVA